MVTSFRFQGLKLNWGLSHMQTFHLPTLLGLGHHPMYGQRSIHKIQITPERLQPFPSKVRIVEMVDMAAHVHTVWSWSPLGDVIFDDQGAWNRQPLHVLHHQPLRSTPSQPPCLCSHILRVAVNPPLQAKLSCHSRMCARCDGLYDLYGQVFASGSIS